MIATHLLGTRVLPCTPGEPCGDAAACWAWPGPAPGGGDGGVLLAIIDGLGHGAEAAEAAQAALRVLAGDPSAPLAEQMARLDAVLLSTRGAAVGLARIDGPRLQYAGVGNTRALRWRGDQVLRLSSQYGIVGGGLPARLQSTEIELLPDDWLLLFTDGIDERVHLSQRLPEWERDPGLLCDHLLDRWRDRRDDAGVLALQWRGG